MARNGLSVRCRTTESQKAPDRFIDKLIAYISPVRRQWTRHSYSHSDIIALDETAAWQDMLSSTTIDLLTTWEKNRFHWKQQDMRSAKGDGIKLNPFIVVPGPKRETKQLNEEFKNKCYVTSSVNWWMNEDLTRDWCKFPFIRRMLA